MFVRKLNFTYQSKLPLQNNQTILLHEVSMQEQHPQTLSTQHVQELGRLRYSH